MRDGKLTSAMGSISRSLENVFAEGADFFFMRMRGPHTLLRSRNVFAQYSEGQKNKGRARHDTRIPFPARVIREWVDELNGNKGKGMVTCNHRILLWDYTMHEYHCFFK